MDRLIDAIAPELDPEKQKLIGWKAAEIIMREQGSKIPLDYPINGFGIWNKRVQGYRVSTNAHLHGTYQNYNHTWLLPE